MRTGRPAMAALLVGLGMLAPGVSHAGQDFQAGFVVTIEAPPMYTPGASLPVSGFLVAVARAPLVLEFSHGVADEQIDLVVEGDVAASTTTGADGAYAFELPVDHTLPPEVTIHTVAFGDSVIETHSRHIVVSSTHVLTELSISPEGATLSMGQVLQLVASATYDDGRQAQDVTETVIWSSSDEGVASVSNVDGETGVVTGVGPGSATITAELYGRATTASIVVT